MLRFSHKEKLDEENASYDAAETEERKQLEQEEALKLALRKKAVQQCGQFKRIECNDRTFTITARHGMSLLSFGENVTIHVVATSTQETEVRIESASRIFLNFINGGANKKNVQSLEDYIRNEVYKLCSDEEIKLKH